MTEPEQESRPRSPGPLRRVLAVGLGIAAVLGLRLLSVSCVSVPDTSGRAPMTSPSFPIEKSDAEWQKKLTPEQYYVTRQQGTERAFSGAYWDHAEPGAYECVCCGHKLFEAADKFDAGCGWPSFTQAVDEETVEIREDHSHGMRRTEVVCSRCGAHLGHVFTDGPAPTGLRFCINSASLSFDPTDSESDEAAPEPDQTDE